MFALAASRVNGLRNPLLGEQQVSPEFEHFIELYDRLRRADVLDIVQRRKTGTESRYFWDFHDYERAYGESVRELLDLLGIEAKADGSPILLPLRVAVGSSASAVHMQTRSAYEVLRMFRMGVEIPSPHLDAGIAEPLTVTVPEERRIITIRSSEKRPKDASVRIRFRDQWFYIDVTDSRASVPSCSFGPYRNASRRPDGGPEGAGHNRPREVIRLSLRSSAPEGNEGDLDPVRILLHQDARTRYSVA